MEELSSTVDASQPFRSVKEAVSIFGDRLLVGDVDSPKPTPVNIARQDVLNQDSDSNKPLRVSSSSRSSPMKGKEEETTILDTVKRLEAELEEIKVELKLLKGRESETEVALASLNAELHKNMSKLAEAEAAAAAAAAAAASSRRMVVGAGGGGGGKGKREEGRKREDQYMMIRMEESPTLAEILSNIDNEKGGRKEKRRMMKKKPIMPLVGDFFSWRKRSYSCSLQYPLYSSPHMYS